MSEDDFTVEPIRGLPARPPQGEDILWQGAPDWRALALDAFGLRWVAGYFGVLALWRLIDGTTAGVGWALVLGLVACGILALIAYVLARSTVYTITTHRVAMRIGAALTVTLNLPFTKIDAIDRGKGALGTGTLALRLQAPAKLSYLVCWPHVRPWRMGDTQPALRCVPDPDTVATVLARAARARIDEAGAQTAPSPSMVAAE